ncbi:MAG: bifunctional DNA-formamidopyrimidine glycosylase/DNA-(apurinic or apyrimidinic site) lyase [Candidatus Nomurabacteria bacterium]|jgi:formamidopyrimidine-DNA glycosylase|nr:bifunctional DNA-formamidopyrimidine glycosylase/DNA-(apurinic or apyrimidinic site) lyase [Candidatus Nomurabacteria bacterium]
MPELPEVETVRRGLTRLIVGRRILDIRVLNDKSFQANAGDAKAFLLGTKVEAIRRRAKVLIIDLSSKYSLVIHLKMTGQLVFRGDEAWAAGHPTDSFVADLPDRSTRIEFALSGGAKLFFNDQRKFGWVKLLPTGEVENLDFLRKVGPEPLTGDRDLPRQFLSNIRRRNNTTVKAALLDQTVVAGIGNIYADESLWAARIHPTTRVRDLSDAKLRTILRAAIDVMNQSIASGGSTMKNYIRADGTKGNYLEKFANVFRRDGLPCPRCGHEILKTKVAGRGTHFCPKCQRSPK